MSRTKIFDTVNQRSMYRGKIEDLKKNILAKTEGIAPSYPFKMSFIVERDGYCTDLKIEGADAVNNEKIKRILLPMTDRWIPAGVNGEKVRSRYTLTFP